MLLLIFMIGVFFSDIKVIIGVYSDSTSSLFLHLRNNVRLMLINHRAILLDRVKFLILPISKASTNVRIFFLIVLYGVLIEFINLTKDFFSFKDFNLNLRFVSY